MSSEPVTKPVPAVAPLLHALKFDEHGLVAAIAQDASTGVVRMLGWASAEALEKTLATGRAWFWSRSRRALWQKGESSGHVLDVRELRVDCDGDAILYLVDAAGPTCHTGKTSCFFRHAPPGRGLVDDDGPAAPPSTTVDRVVEVIARRARERPERSYVVSLLDGGMTKIGGKITEEAGELVEALPAADRAHTVHEAADLLFHVLVGLEAAGLPWRDVCAELARRFGTSGIDEKAARAKPAPERA